MPPALSISKKNKKKLEKIVSDVDLSTFISSKELDLIADVSGYGMNVSKKKRKCFCGAKKRNEINKIESQLEQPKPENIKSPVARASKMYSNECAELEDYGRELFLDKAHHREHVIQPPLYTTKHAHKRMKERSCLPGEKMMKVVVDGKVVTAFPMMNGKVSGHFAGKFKHEREAKRGAFCRKFVIDTWNVKIGVLIGNKGEGIREITKLSGVFNINIEDRVRVKILL
ncbi:hypothetical protein TL16_g07157 [Triparma laevis f. inornata]|uniref:Uncharacterized protein n=1 Tax=Triparma laevis f. inornata TaxID=1714386 RepID=A0A9W7APA7_9STRA|nr:hypothetical protein TL16_g07157 [Triparma laevis f. inornata]